MSSFLRTTSRVVLLATLVYAPWALACQPPWATHLLEVLILAAVGCWMAGALASGSWMPAHKAMIVVAALIAVYGWASTLHLASVVGQTGELYIVAWQEMVLVSSLLLASFCFSDLLACPRWRTRFWWVVVGTGASVGLLGIAQHLGAEILFDQMRPNEGYPFGPFNYHANAGAFLNLVLPLVIGLAVACFRREGLTLKCALAVMAAVVVVCGITVNVSRAAQVVAAMELLSLALVLRTPRSDEKSSASKALPHDRRRFWRSWKTAAATGLFAIVMTAVVALASGQSLQRWKNVAASLQMNSSRPLLWRVCWGMARDAACWGEGPGTFKVLFPRSPHMLPELYGKYIVHDYRAGQPVSMWNHAHNDYLQTVIEWGWAGATLWAAMMLGTVYLLARSAFASSFRADQRNRILTGCAAIALLGILTHAWVDFPLQVEAIRFYVAGLFGLALSQPSGTPGTPSLPAIS